MKRNLFGYIMIALSTVLSIINIVLLQDPIAVQWNSNGISNYGTTFEMLIVCVGVSILGFILRFVLSKKYSVQMVSSKGFNIFVRVFSGIIMTLGPIIAIIILIMNK